MSEATASGLDVADSCDRCHQPIPYRAVCYMVPTGRTWDREGDPDTEKPVVQIVCADCYSGPALGMGPITAIKAEEL